MCFKHCDVQLGGSAYTTLCGIAPGKQITVEQSSGSYTVVAPSIEPLDPLLLRDLKARETTAGPHTHFGFVFGLLILVLVIAALAFLLRKRL